MGFLKLLVTLYGICLLSRCGAFHAFEFQSQFGDISMDYSGFAWILAKSFGQAVVLCLAVFTATIVGCCLLSRNKT